MSLPIRSSLIRHIIRGTPITSSTRHAFHSSSSRSAQKNAPSSKTYTPLPAGWEAVIGVEVHAQLKTKAKLFSDAPTPDDRRTSQSPENSCVGVFDAALPGTLPALQKDALQLALRACLALDCQVNDVITFDRKHYFYPDLPSGFQITQKYSPLARNGQLRLSSDDGLFPEQKDAFVVTIEQVQLEQDTAKSSHRITDAMGEVTTIDVNRANSPLIEIVSGPDMRTPEEVGAYIRKLRETLRRIGASDGNMDEGSMRCDVNVSVHRHDQPWGTRCEIKNINSIKFAMNAIVYEMHRQQKALEAGQLIEQETRAYDEEKASTYKLRSKEDAPDYRYMPDPNLPPLIIDSTLLHTVRQSLPELPDAQRQRLMSQYGVGVREVNVLMRIGLDDESSAIDDGEAHARSSSEAVRYFEQLADGRDGPTTMNWLIHELLKALNAHNKTFAQNPLSVEHFGQLIDLIQSDKVTKSTAKELLAELIATDCAVLDKDANAVRSLLESRNALALDSEEALQSVCKDVVAALPDAVAAVQKGNTKVLQRLIGEVMRRTKGRANAKAAGELLAKLVAESAPSSS